MLQILWFLWRIGVPLVGLSLEAGCVYGIVGIWQGGSMDVPMNLFLTSLIVAAMVLIVLVVLLIEGQFSIVYRGALPAFMGVLAVAALFLLVMAISDTAPSEDIKSALFGSMKFYAIMLAIGIWIVVETLWIALIFVIQGLPGVSLKCLIGGGCLLGLALVVTFIYWIAMMLIYFFAHYYQIFFIVFGSAMGGLYLVFLIVYCVVKRSTLSEIFNDNLDKYWRDAV